MTTENKAKGYNESVNEPIRFADAQDFFSEPKESEDERIRENCIHFLELQKSHHASTFEIEECIAWLEKQCDNNIACSEEQMKVFNEVLNFAANHESPHWNDYIFGTLNNFIRQLTKLREK